MTSPEPNVSREDLHLLYNVSFTDVSGFKQQQWNVANNALLLQAGLVGVAELIGQKLTAPAAWLLIVLSGALAAAAILVVITLQCSIEARRVRLERVRKELGETFEKLWDVRKPPDPVHWLLYIVLAVACGVVVWLIVGKL